MLDLVTIGEIVVEAVVTADVTLEPPAKLNFGNVFELVLSIPPKIEVAFDVSESVAL